MAKLVTPLTDSKIKNSKPKDKEYNLSDGAGLSLRIKPNGTKLWLLNYVRPKTNKRTNLKLGIYPEVALAKARERRQFYRGLLADGIDPQNHIQQESEKHLDKNSFKHWATACLATKTNLTQKTQYGFQSRLD
ncbi:integrase arm-type DNA-binding domain-containing protein, partial [Ostreibacterium oceani]